jgi:hypothetical protein
VWLLGPGAAATLRGETIGDIEHPLGVVLAIDDQDRHPPRIRPCQCCALPITPATMPTADQARAGACRSGKSTP